jgi:hypothetical protein
VGKDTELRSALLIEGETPPGHCERVRKLKAKFSHTIKCVDRIEEGTCVTHALGLLDQHRRLVHELEGLDVRAGLDFIEWLLDESRMAELDKPKAGALALYFNEGSWKHAGVMRSKARLRSKWGTYFAFDHRLPEVPSDYGDEVHFFELPSSDDAARRLFEFACYELQVNDAGRKRLHDITGLH